MIAHIRKMDKGLFNAGPFVFQDFFWFKTCPVFGRPDGDPARTRRNRLAGINDGALEDAAFSGQPPTGPEKNVLPT
jgi:hypothetical protein